MSCDQHVQTHGWNWNSNTCLTAKDRFGPERSRCGFENQPMLWCGEDSYLGLLNLERRKYTAFSDGGIFSLFTLTFFLPVRKGIDDEWHPVLLVSLARYFSPFLPLSLALALTLVQWQETKPLLHFLLSFSLDSLLCCGATVHLYNTMQWKSIEIMQVQRDFSACACVRALTVLNAYTGGVSGIRTVCPL